MITCRDCKVEKEESVMAHYTYKGVKTPRKICRECVNRQARENNLKRKSKDWSHIKTSCRVCEEVIPYEDISPSFRGRPKAICKPCQKKQKEDQYANDPEKRAYHKRYYRENAERQRENVRKNRQNNPEYAREYRQRPEVKVRKSQARRIKKALAIKGTAKSYATLEYLGCTAPELKCHLEGQFRDGMNWDNYGFEGWHIDHIKPLCQFDLTDPDQQKECFHFSNLQPLWAAENLAKGGGRFE